jgi:hypothetical protein
VLQVALSEALKEETIFLKALGITSKSSDILTTVSGLFHVKR